MLALKGVHVAQRERELGRHGGRQSTIVVAERALAGALEDERGERVGPVALEWHDQRAAVHERVVGKRLLGDAVADLHCADLGQRVPEHGDDALRRRGVGSGETVAVVERLHGHDLAVAHRVGGDVGLEQLRPGFEHLAHDAGLVAQASELERKLLQRLELGREALEAFRTLPLRVVEMGVVERERGELADRPDELDLLGRVRALLLVVEELDHADDPIARLEGHAELTGLAVLAQQPALVLVQRRIVDAHDRDRLAGLDDARRGRVVLERPETADHLAKVEPAAVVAHERAHRVEPRLEHVDVARTHVEQRDEALDDRLDHRARLEAGGEIEARFDDERQVAVPGIELGDQAGVLDGDGHVAADAPGEPHLLARERPGAFSPVEDHGPQAEVEGPQRHDEHALQLEVVQVRRRRQAALGKPGANVVDRQDLVFFECVSQNDERLVRVAQGLGIGLWSRTPPRRTIPRRARRRPRPRRPRARCRYAARRSRRARAAPPACSTG